MAQNLKNFASPTSSRSSSTTSSDSSGQATITTTSTLPANLNNNKRSLISSKSTNSSRFCSNNKFKFISLNCLTMTCIVFALQIYLIYNCFKQLRDLITVNSNDSSVTSKLTQSIIINASLITFSILFTIACFVFSLFRLGVYSHDNFKLGKHFTNRKIKNQDDNTSKSSQESLASNSSVNTSIPSNSAMSKQKLTKPVSLSYFGSTFECCCLLFKKPSFWSELPPLGTCFHLLAALFLLIAQLQLNSKRIQISQKPIGDIFATKLDFLIGEPINRLEKLNLIKTNIKKRSDNNHNTNNSSNDILNEIIHSKDDFSIFDNQYFSLVSTSNAIGLDYLNYLIGLILFTVKISQTFWFTSRKFTFLLFVNFLIISIQMSVSYCSFEILYKSNNLKIITNQLILFSKADTPPNNQLNESNNFTHDITLAFLYLLSSFLLFTSGYLNCKLGYKNFEKVRLKFEKSIGKYMLNNGVIINLNTTLDQTKSKSDDLNTTLRTHTVIDLKHNQIINNNNKKQEIISPNLKFFFTFKENLISSFLFLIYTITRFFFIYELHIIYKFTHDYFLICAIVIEMITLLVWILTLILLAIKTEWLFKIDSSYKLTYWNWLYYSINHSKERHLSGHISSTNSDTLKCYSMNTNLNQLETNPTLKKTNDYFMKTVNQPNNSTTNIPNNNNNNNIATNSNANIGLLVRDDSVLLNRSSNLSSSSITEVSSLLPSACGHLSNIATQSFNSGSVKKLNGINILNPCSLTSSLASTSILNTKITTRQFKIQNNNSNVKKSELNDAIEASKYYDEKRIKHNYNPTTTKTTNEIVLIEEEENNLNNDSIDYYKRLNRSDIFESDDSDLNNNNNNNDMIKEYSNYVKSQQQKLVLDSMIDSKCNTTNSTNSHSSDEKTMNTFKPSIPKYNVSFRASKNNATVGEIMEPALSVRDARLSAASYSNVINRALNKIVTNDTTTSSSVSTTDSGRDSLVDSPVNAKQNQLQVQQHQQQQSNLTNSQLILPAKSFLLTNSSTESPVGNHSNSNLKLNTSSNFSDDCC